MAIRERSTPSAKLLEIERIESGYGRTRILKGVDLELHEGEIVAIVGPNGAGKTTLLNTISGLTTVHAGEIRLDGEVITGMPAHRITRRGIGHCPEGRRIFQRLSVEDNLVAGYIADQFEVVRTMADGHGSSCTASSSSTKPAPQPI